MRKLVVLLIALFVSYSLAWSLEISTGTSFKAPNTLAISQSGFEDYSVTDARYETRPWSNFSSLAGLTENYYTVRLGNRVDNLVYEVEWIHDKSYYVSGNDPENVVQHFELSDGHNVALFNVGYVYEVTDDFHLVSRAGFGLSIPNPATEIRGLQNGTRTHLSPESKYYITGPAAQLSSQARYYISEGFALTLEGKYVVSQSFTPIAEGTARATFNGIHINFGVLFGF
jgi:hypothetical protein